MNYKKFTDKEKKIWKRAKIVGYYQAKAKLEKKNPSTRRYGNFDIEEAFNKALARTYGKTR